MALSTNTILRLMAGLGDKSAGQEVANALNGLHLMTGQISSAPGATFTPPSFGAMPVLLVVATSVSTTVNFSSLAVGDQVLILPAVAGNAMFVTCAVAGTLPQAAVVGSLYLALRSFAAPTQTTVSF